MLFKVLRKGWALLQEGLLFKELNLPERYGKGSWALVTGGTEGIGLAFVKSLAKRGFNIAFVGRDTKKNGEKAQELQKEFIGVSFRPITADFSKGITPEFYQNLEKALSDIDISILVNNVGILYTEPIDKLSSKQVCDFVVVNCVSHAMMLQKFMNRLNSRSKRSAIIDISSTLALKETYVVSLYTATKVFNKFLTLGTAFAGECKNIDHLCVKPFVTATGLVKMNNASTNTSGIPEVNAFVADPSECSEGSLQCLGHTTETYGAKKHLLYNIIMETVYSIFPTIVAEYIRMEIRGKFVRIRK